MKSIFTIILFCSISMVFGKGDPIPASLLRGVSVNQVKHIAAGKNQYEKLPKCPDRGRHFEICPLCNGSGQIIYIIKGKCVGTFDCFQCGPGKRSNSPDGLIIARGEDYSDCYFPEKTIHDVEMEITREANLIDGDIELLADNGRKVKRGHLNIALGFQNGKYINSLNFNWDYRGNQGKQTVIMNKSSSRTKYTIINDEQMSLEFHVLKYATDKLTVRLIQKQRELFPKNKKEEKTEDKDSKEKT